MNENIKILEININYFEKYMKYFKKCKNGSTE